MQRKGPVMPEREPVLAFIGLGANLGDPVLALRAAVQAINGLPHTQVTACSSLYRSAPQEAVGPDFVNAVLTVQTRLCAPDLLAALLQLETQAGRQRPYLNAPRTLDLDLLLYGHARIDSPALTLPHPRMNQRAFVLVPLAEIGPLRVSPAQLAAIAGQSISQLAPPPFDAAR